jgi:thioredoxin-like negative regulator of GroEL
VSTHEPPAPPDALLLIATTCPHCAAVLQAMAALVKSGAVATLEVVNVAVAPRRAQELGVRSVPWLRLGSFELEGAHSEAELRAWAEKAGTPGGMGAYLAELLKTGRRAKALESVRRGPEALSALIDLLSAADTDITVRLGADSIIEDLQGSDLLLGALDRFAALSRDPEPRFRGDACHYLALTASPKAIPHLKARLDDENADVREIARESLETLGAAPG